MRFYIVASPRHVDCRRCCCCCCREHQRRAHPCSALMMLWKHHRFRRHPPHPRHRRSRPAAPAPSPRRLPLLQLPAECSLSSYGHARERRRPCSRAGSAHQANRKGLTDDDNLTHSCPPRERDTQAPRRFDRSRKYTSYVHNSARRSRCRVRQCRIDDEGRTTRSRDDLLRTHFPASSHRHAA